MERGSSGRAMDVVTTCCPKQHQSPGAGVTRGVCFRGSQLRHVLTFSRMPSLCLFIVIADKVLASSSVISAVCLSLNKQKISVLGILLKDSTWGFFSWI